MKLLERWGRQWLVRLASLLFAARRRALQLPPTPRILVVRTDARLGNVVMLTPILGSLRRAFPAATIDVLVHPSSVPLLAGHPAVSGLIPYTKRALFSATGPFGTVWRLRRRPYDLVIDATNPTDPSATQALLTRLSGARHSLGPAQGPFAALYSRPVAIPGQLTHEIDLRLALLSPLGISTDPRPTLGPATQPPRPEVRGAIDALATPFVVLNVGARLSEKRLAAGDYVKLAHTLLASGLEVLVTWGPGERALAQATVDAASGAHLAPPTGLADLGYVLRKARLVVSCDTGPMHLAVALSTPTCALFVSTDPQRYGYGAPHAALDWRTPQARQDLVPLRQWLDRTLVAMRKN